jgi:hypothetical protein
MFSLESMSDRNRYQLVTEMPEVRPLSMGKDDLRQLADMLRARLGRHYEHPTELLDQAVLAHFRTDSPSWQSLFDWTRERVLESVPKHLHNKIDQEEVRKIVLAEMHAQGTLFDAMTKHSVGDDAPHLCSRAHRHEPHAGGSRAGSDALLRHGD